MIKVLAFEIPKMVYDWKNKELKEIANFKILDKKIFAIWKIKELKYINFTNDFLQIENSENNEIINQTAYPEASNFLNSIIPNIIQIWNNFNEKKLEELKNNNLDEENILKYFEENNLQFPGEISLKILFI